MTTFGTLVLVVLIWHYFYQMTRIRELKKSMIERELFLLNLMQSFTKDHLNARELQAVAHPYPLTILLSEEELKPYITKRNNLWSNSKEFQDICQLVNSRKESDITRSKIYDRIGDYPLMSSIFRDTLE